jgi:hypothetical protein
VGCGSFAVPAFHDGAVCRRKTGKWNLRGFSIFRPISHYLLTGFLGVFLLVWCLFFSFIYTMGHSGIIQVWCVGVMELRRFTLPTIAQPLFFFAFCDIKDTQRRRARTATCYTAPISSQDYPSSTPSGHCKPNFSRHFPDWASTAFYTLDPR